MTKQEPKRYQVVGGTIVLACLGAALLYGVAVQIGLASPLPVSLAKWQECNRSVAYQLQTIDPDTLARYCGKR